MRLKEDSTSWRASGIIKRDARHIHDDAGAYRPSNNKKDKSKWCKGRVGIQHNYVMVEKPWVGTSVIRIEQCTQCRKRNWKVTEYPADSIAARLLKN